MFAERAVTLVVVIRRLRAVCTPSVVLRVIARVRPCLNCHPRRISVQWVLALTNDGYGIGFLSTPRKRVLEVYFMVGHLLNGSFVVVPFLRIVQNRVRVNVGRRFSFGVVTRGCLVTC